MSDFNQELKSYSQMLFNSNMGLTRGEAAIVAATMLQCRLLEKQSEMLTKLKEDK